MFTSKYKVPLVLLSTVLVVGGLSGCAESESLISDVKQWGSDIQMNPANVDSYIDIEVSDSSELGNAIRVACDEMGQVSGTVDGITISNGMFETLVTEPMCSGDVQGLVDTLAPLLFL